MVFKKYHAVCSIYISGIALTTGLCVVLAVRTELYATLGLAVILVIGLGYALLRYVDKTNRDIVNFLASVRDSDFSANRFRTDRGGSYQELGRAFDEVVSRFRDTRVEEEEHRRYLANVITHASIGLIVFDAAGRIDFINTAARRLLRIAPARSIAALAKQNQTLTARLLGIKPNKKVLMRVETDSELRQISLEAVEFKLRGRTIKLVSLQNIAKELAEQEMVAWQNLVQVLSHEIMNSVAPIASLASTSRKILATARNDTARDPSLCPDDISDLEHSVTTIEKRSEALVDFVHRYRQLNSIPRPEFKVVLLRELFDRVVRLASSREDAGRTLIEWRVEPRDLTLIADAALIEQVLINLLTNSIQAVADRQPGFILLTAQRNSRSNVTIRVTDNGPGIQPKVLKSVFIPFFTTKSGGTGLGLSLSRQIVRLHGGQLTAHSAPGKETTFAIAF